MVTYPLSSVDSTDVFVLFDGNEGAKGPGNVLFFAHFVFIYFEKKSTNRHC